MKGRKASCVAWNCQFKSSPNQIKYLDCGEPASHFILTMSHWSSGLPVCFLSQGTWVQIPRGVLIWGSARELSLSAHMGGGDPLPTSGSGKGDVITPAFRGMSGTTVTSLLRGTGGFKPNHLSESLNPFIHTGGPRCGRSFRSRLRQWHRWHESWSVEMTSYVYVFASEYVTARLHRH